MDSNSHGIGRIRTALFVDFDNIYTQLKDEDKEAAAAFVRDPREWVNWLEGCVPVLYPEVAGFRRKIIIRRCYMNPTKEHRRLRPSFTISAFEVIDCPPLTLRGKTCTDMHLVIDALDALNNADRIDEFIVLSADADFTPLLVRLRKHDRMTSILHFGNASPAYKSASDAIISSVEFIRKALRVHSEDDEDPASKIPPADISPAIKGLLLRMAEQVYKAAEQPTGVQFSELPAIFMKFGEFRERNQWLGFGSLRKMTQSLVSQRNDLAIIGTDPMRITRCKPAATGQEEAGAGPSLPGPAECVVAPSGERIDIDKGGFGSRYPTLAPLALKIAGVTGTPYLPPDHYAVLLQETAREVRDKGYQLRRTSANVRDRCVESGVAVSAEEVQFILRGCSNSGHWFNRSSETAEQIAAAVAARTLSLCKFATLELNAAEIESVKNWVSGGAGVSRPPPYGG